MFTNSRGYRCNYGQNEPAMIRAQITIWQSNRPHKTGLPHLSSGCQFNPCEGIERGNRTSQDLRRKTCAQLSLVWCKDQVEEQQFRALSISQLSSLPMPMQERCHTPACFRPERRVYFPARWVRAKLTARYCAYHTSFSAALIAGNKNSILADLARF